MNLSRGPVLLNFRSIEKAKALAIFDRDGTLNYDGGYTHKIPDLAFVDGALPALSVLYGLPIAVAVASNQSGVGRGLFSLSDVLKFNLAMRSVVMGKTGVCIDSWAICVHVPFDNCDCRKPQPGLVDELKDLYPFVPNSKIAVFGDKESDIESARRASVEGFLVPPGQLKDSVTNWVGGLKLEI